MLDNFQAFLGTMAQPETQQAEREATIELMIITMYVDKSLKLAEEEAINEYLRNLTWESWLPSDKFLGVAVPKVRSALGDKQKMIALLEDINQRISSKEQKIQAIEACRKLAIADGELSQEEKDFLDTAGHIFQVS